MKGYKASYWGVCRDQLYQEGWSYEINRKRPTVCGFGLHFCEFPFQTKDYYDLNFGLRLFGVEGEGIARGSGKFAARSLYFSEAFSEKESVSKMFGTNSYYLAFDKKERIIQINYRKAKYDDVENSVLIKNGDSFKKILFNKEGAPVRKQMGFIFGRKLKVDMDQIVDYNKNGTILNGVHI